ncbi:MAG TPA: FKBP-type peptidyl-prolyl cis-trans isomerase [Planctomycetota bacterium]|nr:FKBP-type peptidyl-prolyl cis-trans isomerase [Planctomycetota bacterium]
MTSLPLTLLTLSLLVGAVRAQDATPPIPADTEIVTTPSGLKYSVLKEGSGRRPKVGSNVSVHYTGWLTDGTVFDSSVQRGQPFDFTLGQGAVIKGWDEGVALMQKGSRLKLTIPYELAYGEQGRPPTIPPKSTLIFEVELLDFLVLPEMVAADPAKRVALESGIAYQVLEAGTGEPIPVGHMCEFEYALFTTEGKLVDTSVTRGGTVQDSCGQSQMAFMNEVMPLMRSGAWWRVDVPSDQVGYQRQPPDLGPGTTSVWQLRIVGVKAPLPAPEFVALDPAKTVTTATGLKYEVVREGRADGKKPRLGQQVEVHYSGWLTDGTAFDSSFKKGEPSQFRLGGVITGWNEGLQLMGEGAVYRFEIPANLAYGAAGRRPTIPPNATLVFYIELIQVGAGA